MMRGATKTFRVAGILFVLFFSFCAFASLSQPVRAINMVTASVTVGSGPEGVAITPNGQYAYVTNEGGTTVSVISTASNAVTATVNVGSKPTGVAITPNGEYAYVTNAGGTTVSVISTSSTASPSPTVPEFPAQLPAIMLAVFMVIIISVIAIAKKKTIRKI